MELITLILLVLGGGVLSRQLVRWGSAQAEKQFIADVTEDVARLLAAHFGGPAEKYQSALLAAKAGRPAPALAGVMRVDCQVEIVKAGLCKRRVSVAATDAQGAAVLEAQRALPWERVPATLRQTFLRDGVAALAFVFYEPGEVA